MKKTLILFAVLALTITTHSQSLTFGPLIGFNSSKLTTDIPDLYQEAKANFLFGAFLRVGKKFYVQPEIAYTSKGGISFSEVTQGAQTTINLKQLEVPVMVGFKLINLEVVNLRIMAGPVMGFVTDKDIQANDLVQQPISSDWLKDTQWGMQLGAGVDVLFLTLDVRYEFGINNMYTPPAGGDPYDMRSNLWRISLGWLIL